MSVVGRVTDDAGRPIAGALVRTKLNFEARQATTGADGTYRLTGCDVQPVRIVVSAPGRAPEVRDVQVEPAMAAVDFQMRPGRTVSVRVLDERGTPVRRARIFFQRWRGQYAYFEFQNVNQFTDNDGLWVWNERRPTNSRPTSVAPTAWSSINNRWLREREYVFHTSPALVVSGRVMDAATKQPIKAFQVVPGVRFLRENELQKPAVAFKASNEVRAIPSDDPNLAWNATESYAASDGAYRFRWTRSEVAHLIRIEADGYQPAVSREVKSNEGQVAIDFALERDHGMAAKVVSPRNQAAAGAGSRCVEAGSQIIIRNGAIDDRLTSCPRRRRRSRALSFPAPEGTLSSHHHPSFRICLYSFIARMAAHANHPSATLGQSRGNLSDWPRTGRTHSALAALGWHCAGTQIVDLLSTRSTRRQPA